MTSNRDFWVQQEPHSKVKTRIITGYFAAWSNVMKTRSKELTYLDLCSGPGKYDNGDISTPLEILSTATRIPELQSKLHIHFYEIEGKNCNALIKHVSEHEASRWLHHAPQVHCESVGRELIDRLPMRGATLTFLDPHGYNEISLGLLEALISDWGSDCVFYLPVVGINRNLNQVQNADSLIRIFTSEGYNRLRQAALRQTPFPLRLITVMRRVLQSRRHLYMLPFAFEAERKRMITHFLIFVTKHERGFAIMKDIMSNPDFCLYNDDGEPVYRYRPPSRDLHLDFPKNYSRLRSRLLRDFRGRSLTLGCLLDECHSKGYFPPTKVIKAAVQLLVELRVVSVELPANSKAKAIIGPKTVLRFSAR